MKKSLYLKFILGYILFALFSFFTIATISARLTYHHCLEQQAGILRADAVRMADECSSLYTGGSETPETLYPELTRISSFLDARLWIIDMNGTIAYDSEGELKDTTVEEFRSRRYGEELPHRKFLPCFFGKYAHCNCTDRSQLPHLRLCGYAHTNCSHQQSK